MRKNAINRIKYLVKIKKRSEKNGLKRTGIKYLTRILFTNVKIYLQKNAKNLIKFRIKFKNSRG